MTAGFDPERTAATPFRRVGIAAEHESPENPRGCEVRVALTPDAVNALVRRGCEVAVERGAGVATGYSDAAYAAAGATVESRDTLYRSKDLVIKLKGPAHDDLARMESGSSLLCMAHVRSIPQRAAVAEKNAVNIIAMELIRESPGFLPDTYLRGRLAMEQMMAGASARSGPWAPAARSLALVGFSEDAFGALQYAARLRPRSLQVLPAHPPPDLDPAVLAIGAEQLGEIAAALPSYRVEEYRAGLALRGDGRRRIQCLHETGRAGARFGIDLVLRRNRHIPGPAGIRTTILGYGNVAFGALDECVRSGVSAVDILTKRTTARPSVRRYLRSSDLIINGAELPARWRGTRYLITEDDLRFVLRPGTVVVDLVGGCATNRTAVEPIVECTDPAEPYIVRNGVCLASVWGWPLLGFRRESAERYSRQITDVLLGEEGLIDGPAAASPGIQRAFVAGPMVSGPLSGRPSSQ